MKKGFLKQLGGFLKSAKKGLKAYGSAPERKPRRVGSLRRRSK